MIARGVAFEFPRDGHDAALRGGAAGLLLRAGREGWAFTASAVAMAATVSSLFVGLSPNVLVSSTDAAYNLNHVFRARVAAPAARRQDSA